VIALLVWKVLTAATLVQDGWCVRTMPSAPYAKDAIGAPHAWDIRADWRADDPPCSAIMTRRYSALSEFPVWFFNLPPPSDSWPGPRDRPPGATVAMTVTGFLHAGAPGLLRVDRTPDVAAVLREEGAPPVRDVSAGVALSPGTHRVLVDATLTGDRWNFAPLWNGTDVWSGIATVKRPSALDLIVRPWSREITAILVVALIGAWIVSVVSRTADLITLVWTLAASLWIGTLAAYGHDALARWSIAGLAAAVLLRVHSRLRNMFGAFLLVGVPWLTLVVVLNAQQAGHFRLYEVGSDFWMYQRFAYRIVMQGYWLEGGSATFYFQPLYRWIAGLLHVVFGDSSVGEAFWDGGCVLVMAMFAFAVTRIVAGFRWGLAAAVGSLATFALGTPWRYLGIGLADISGIGLMYLAALMTLRSRHGRWPSAIVAGVLAVLAFYTRLNQLPLSLALVVFALPLHGPVQRVWRPSTWTARNCWPLVVTLWGAIAIGLVLFAWRTYHYTGVFSILHGTSGYRQSVWQPGMSIGAYLRAVASSIAMVLTMNDPPQFDWRALPLMAGVAISALALVGVRRLRELPPGPVLFCLAGIAGAFVARGEAYPGRFSIHLIGSAWTVVACTAALFTTGTKSSILNLQSEISTSV
jgi:hypothetical protein